MFESATAEKALDADSSKKTIVAPFNAFASAGVAEVSSKCLSFFFFY